MTSSIPQHVVFTLSAFASESYLHLNNIQGGTSPLFNIGYNEIAIYMGQSVTASVV
jgi:hypothetical protein